MKKSTCEIFNADGSRAIDDRSIESLTECVMNLEQTKSKHIGKNGDYTPSRKKLHAQIIKKAKEDVICIEKGKPIAVLMGGSPASGKSTFLKRYRSYLLSENLFKVDADEIRAELPEYKGWNAAQTHEETGDIVKTLISDKNIGVPCKFDFIYDGTMTNVRKYLSLIDLLKNEGYEVFVVFITNIPKEVVKKRALERYQKSGRFVPMMVIDDFYKNGDATFEEVKKKVDGYILVDGSTFDYNIIDQGGKNLPNQRIYSKLGKKVELSKGGSMYADGGEVSFTEYKGKSIMFEPHFNEYYVGDAGPFSTMDEAKLYIDGGSQMPESIRGAYERGLFANGGMVGKEVEFDYWQGGTKKGTVIEVLPSGKYNVRTGFGTVLVSPSEIIKMRTGGEVKRHFKPSDFYKLGGSIDDMTPVEAFFSTIDYTNLPIEFKEFVTKEILTDPELGLVSAEEPIFVEIKKKVQALSVPEAEIIEIGDEDANSETQEAIDLLTELSMDQEGEDRAETLEAIELLKELLV